MNASYYTLREADLGALFERACADYDVVAKTRDANGNLRYGRPASFADVAFVDQQPVLSAKEFALPETETLVSYRREGKTYNEEAPAPPARDILLFGVNVCDAAAFEIIDKVFGWDYKDDPYLGRRERTTLLARACGERQQDCFCERLTFPEDGVDAVAYAEPPGYLVVVRTEKGRALIERNKDLFGTAKDGAATLERLRARAPHVKVAPTLEEAREGLSRSFENPDWMPLASTCVGCGVCTYVCPTCHCFDIRDEGGGVRGARLRVWDHCTGRMFTKMASHQPRDKQYKRYRQRLLHKFWYYPERFGPVLCTGCGRCITYCPVKININELAQYFGGLKAEPPGGPKRK